MHECWKRQEHFTRCAFILFTHSYACFCLVLLLRIGPYSFSDPNVFFLTVTWSCKIMWLNCFAVLWWDNKQSHFLPVLNTFELDSRGLSHVYPHALWCDSWNVAFLSSWMTSSVYAVQLKVLFVPFMAHLVGNMLALCCQDLGPCGTTLWNGSASISSSLRRGYGQGWPYCAPTPCCDAGNIA